MSGSERSSFPTVGLPRPGQRRNGSGRPGMRIWILVVLVVVIVLGLMVLSVSAVAKVGSQGAQGARRPLRPPTALYASGTSDGAVLLSWQPAQPPPVGHRIYRATGRHGSYTIVGAVMGPNRDTFTDSSDLLPGTTYAYTVTAFDRQRESTPVGPIMALVLGASGPTPTVAVPPPLATFTAPTSPTLTAIARSSRPVRTSKPRSGTRAGTGAAMGADMPTGTAGVPTPVPTVARAGVVGAPSTTRQP